MAEQRDKPDLDIEEFYAADERRRSSAEYEFGRDWHDAHGMRCELVWVEATGELYTLREPGAPAPLIDPFGDVIPTTMATEDVTVHVLGTVASLAEVERLLDGWKRQMPKPNSLAWVLGRLREAREASGAP